MKRFQYEILENATKEDFQRVIEQLLPKKRVIYTFIPGYYDDFLSEISSNFVTIKNIEDSKQSFPEVEYTFGYINDDELEFVFEFYERANVIPFVMTAENVDFSTVAVDLDGFYRYFEENNIPHITVGHDQEYLTYYSN